MQDRLTKAFQKAKYAENSNLVENVWQAIVLRDRCIVRVKLWAFSVIGIFSLAGLAPALKTLSTDLAQSGFYEYFSLVFSDSGLILSVWKEFTFSLVESLPVLSIIFTLSLIFVFFLSLRYMAKQIINNRPLGETYGVV